MNYGKRSSLPKTRRKICDMYDDGEDSKDTTKSGQNQKFSHESAGTVARKSRNASEKKRRDQFNILIQELCSMVSTKTRKLDKSAVLRATIHFLKAHNDMVMKSEKNAINENWKPSFLSDDEFSQLMLEALDGFMIVFSQQGHILYTSDSVISLLRHLPKDLESCTIYELIHEDDRPEMFKILSRADSSSGTPDVLGQRSSFTCHMRRGMLEQDKPAEYEPVRFNGSFSVLKPNQAAFTDMVTTPRYCFVATVRLLSTQLSREMATFTEKGNEFTSRHSLDWKFLFLDHRAPPIIGYLPFEVLGTSVYEYYQQDDLDKLGRCHEALMQTGEGTSCYYRFLTKGQEWIWLQTRYFITYNQWNSKPEFIVCTHQVVNYADVRTDINKELELTDSKMSGADSDSTNLWDSSASESASLSTSVSANSSLKVALFSTDESISCTSSLKTPSISHSENRSRVSVSSGKQSESQGPSVSHQPMSVQPSQVMVQPSVPSLYQSNGPVPEQAGLAADGNLTPQQITVIQLKLQEQLMMRHHKLQDAILRQQQELQQVQQQLMMAQQLMMQHHPMLGQMFIQQQEQLMGTSGSATQLTTSEGLVAGGSGATPTQANPAPSVVQQQQGMLGGATPSGSHLEPPGVHQPQLSPQHQPPQQPQHLPPQPQTQAPPLPLPPAQQPPQQQQAAQQHEAISIEHLVQHQSVTRAPFAMHATQQYPSSCGPSSLLQHPTPHRTVSTNLVSTVASPHIQQQHQAQLQHPQRHPHHQPQQQSLGRQGQGSIPHPQPTMHSSMTLPPGVQAVPMQDLSCLGLPTLDMGTDQYMQPPEGQDPL